MISKNLKNIYYFLPELYGLLPAIMCFISVYKLIWDITHLSCFSVLP